MPKKNGKKLEKALQSVDNNKFYPLIDAIKLAKEISYTKFSSTIDLVFNLNLDVRKADQQLRGSIVLPHGTGKTVSVLVLTEDVILQKQAKDAKADFVLGQIDFKEKIDKEDFDFDVIVADLKSMPFLGKYGKKLGPKGLMPNPKIGTVTNEIGKIVSELKKGKANYRTDKSGNIHTIIGKANMDDKDLHENAITIFDVIKKLKPSSVKGTYMKNMVISSTMGPSIKVIIEA